MVTQRNRKKCLVAALRMQGHRVGLDGPSSEQNERMKVVSAAEIRFNSKILPGQVRETMQGLLNRIP